MKGRTAFDPGIILLLLIVAIVVSTGVFLYSKVRVDRFESALEQDEPVSVLLIIADGNSILFSELFLYHHANGKGALADIPANTGSLLRDEGKIGPIEKLFEPDNPDAFIEKVASIAGTEIDFYLTVDLSHLDRLVDLVGGVDTFIPNPVDATIDGDTVLLPSGSFVLDGSKALSYLRHGDPSETESERISRGQSFIRSLLDSFGTTHQRLSVPEVTRAFAQEVETDISIRGLAALFEAMQRLDVENMVQLRLRGTSRRVDDQTLLFPHSEGRLFKETLVQTVNSLKSENQLSEEDLRIGVEILNGTEINGLASRTSQLYQSFGYEVVRVGNAEETYEKTIIIDKLGNQAAARRLADVIRCRNITLQTAAVDFADQLDMNADIVIILGKDFDGRYCKE